MPSICETGKNVAFLRLGEWFIRGEAESAIIGYYCKGGWVGGEAQPVVVTTRTFNKHEISEFHVEAAIVRHRKGGHLRLTDRLLAERPFGALPKPMC
jgi:hypothetical protein